ncbi:MAG: hypothetical protein L0338_34625 [Acidobacteria bacterium]|nr:hypothetical protein [Acidobacteriota bacterium]
MEDQLLGYVVVSDLHLGPGRRPETPYNFKREEDFFFDDEFADFLADLDRERGHEHRSKWRLLINGDLVEFMQILVWPPLGPRGWEIWPGVRVAMFEAERNDGLASTPLKSAWKLEVVAQGHPRFFQALARFIYSGNDLVIIKGNHDAEFYWPEVRRKFVEILATHIDMPGAAATLQLDTWSDSRFVTRPEHIWTTGGTLQFCEFSYADGPLYVEHGNQHEAANAFLDFSHPVHPLFSDPDRGDTFLEFPFGSIFVRYFFNEVEKRFSYADNVKPTTEAIREIWKSHRLEAFKILVSRFRFLLGALTYPPVWIRLRRVVKPVYGTYVLLAVAALTLALVRAAQTVGLGPRAVLEAYRSWGWLLAIVAAILPFLADFFRAGDERYLRQAAARRLAELRKSGQDARFLAYGHTHDPDIWRIGATDAIYFNTGTWTTVFSREERLIRLPRQLVFLKVTRDPEAASDWAARLCHWDPYAAPQQRPLVLEEDSRAATLSSRAYVDEAGLPPVAPLQDERPALLARSLSWLGPIKHLWESALGIPAWTLWSALCLLGHVLRPFWRVFRKHLIRFRFAGSKTHFRRDWRMMLAWFRLSWRLLQD